jgi:two-component system cell cycle response regulator CtrA
MSLGIGAADHMDKPFHSDELTARLLALIRRCNGHACSQIEIGRVTLDLSLHSVRVSERRIHFTPREYAIIEVLILRAGRTLSKAALISHMYGGLDEPEEKIIDVFICKVREKLADVGAPGFIETVWGQGFKVNGVIPSLKETLACL